MVCLVHMAAEIRVLCGVIVEKQELRSRRQQLLGGREDAEQGLVRVRVQLQRGSKVTSMLACMLPFQTVNF